MRSFKKGIAVATLAALCMTSLPLDDVRIVSAAEADSVVRLQPNQASPFHDTNGDGLGEFEGWGTSLCWWANRLGYSEKLTSEAARLFFSDEGLDMNIGRYNVGGGDHVGDTSDVQVPVNENAQFYDLETEGRTPEYKGTSMSVGTIDKLSNVSYTVSDADFGITKGTNVGNFKAIGWINGLGDEPGTGDNLHYTVNVDEEGTYTVKLLMTLAGKNERNVAIQVNEDEEYVVDAATINNNIIASGNNQMLFLVKIPDVALKAGENAVAIAGKGDWTLDFVKMAVIQSGKEGVLPEDAQDEFLHKEHIIRSDSGVPGYAEDVTKIDLTQHDMEWYTANFARADEECGYAWNYNWDADANQINILKAAIAASGEDFIAEAFSNSPSYFMTYSGCSSGATDSSKDNLRADSYNAFAVYMADVIEHWQNNGIVFQSATPMNEPYTNYWGANSNKQEGCHFDQGNSQSKIITALNSELKKRNIDIILSGTDETSIDTQITSYNALSEEAKGIIGRIDTHTYSGSNRAGLSALAESAGKNLWMSEVDGAYTGGTNAGQMSAALGLAQRMMTDVNGLKSSAWILWNAIDMHVDSSEYGQSWVNKGSSNDYLTESAMYAKWQATDEAGYWGLAAANHDTGEILLTKKYYAYGQFSRYIRPGYTIIGSGSNTLAAYDPEGKKAVIVASNTSNADKTYQFDLSLLNTMGSNITAIRTSGSLADGENWADVTAIDNIEANTDARNFKATLKANSITTYIVEGVTYDPQNPPEDTLTEIPVDSSMVTGSKPWNNSSNDASKAVDGDLNTFFDGVLNGWLQIDLGQTMQIKAVSYAPRSGYADRCKGASIYGSNDGENYELLYTITETPNAGALSYVYDSQFASGSNQYRYIKYMVPDDGTSNCNIAELKVYGSEVVEIEEGVAAHYDMSYENGSLKDISGNGKNAVLHETEETDFAVYGEETVMQFNNKQWAELPSGLTGENGTFTVQATFSAPTSGDNWLWCFGKDIGQWGAGNIGDYIFVSPNSSQGNYKGSVLGAIKVGRENQGGESRMPVPTKSLGTGYTTVTLVSDGTTLTMYMDGELVSELTHGKDVNSVIPDGDILGYIGQSLYSADKKLIANVSDIKIWSTALNQDEVKAEIPGEDEKTDMLMADIRKALLKSNTSEDEITADVAFPGSMDGYELNWTIPENTAISQDGKVTIPTGEDVTVEVKAAYGDKEAIFTLRVPGQNIETVLQNGYDELDIPNKDDVRGNITLPVQIGNNVTVTWETDRADIVDVESHDVDGYDSMPAGVVTRPAEDTVVKMTATLSYAGETKTKEITLNVKAAPKAIEESDYTDYFFAYFAGEGYSDGEQIYFASSQDGMNWKDLNNNNPVLTSTLGEQGVRDPFIIRSPEGDKFYLIATDLKINGGNGWDAAQNRGSQSLMVWESTDLVNWTEQRMVEVSAEIEAGCTWAPEATYDPLTGEYVVYWASRTPKVDTKQRLYYAKTRDFYTFTEPQLYIEKDQSSIDTTIIENNGTYYRYTKNEGGSTNELGALTKTIFIEKSSSVLGAFTQIPSDSLNSSDNQYVEGPTIFKLNEDDTDGTDTWCLLVDDFGGSGYYPLITTDLESGKFTAPESGTYKMPSRARHGTPIRITAQEYEAVAAAYGTPDEVYAATYVGQTPELPKTVTVGKTQKNVTWNLDDVSFEGAPYQYVTVKGTVEGSSAQATAKVQIIPKNVEYMIDCNNPDSDSWKNVSALCENLLNTAADQAKTDENTWGYVSTVGSDNNFDMTAYSQNDASNPYAGGWWARGGKNISYQVTLPAGEHNIMMGCTGWWSMGRTMDVYYSYDGVQETKLFDFDAVKSSETYAQGTITLDKEAVVTLTVKKSGNDDPILSWISVSSIPADAPDIDVTVLQEKVNAANELEADNYTVGSYEAVTSALNTANGLLMNPTTQEEVDNAVESLKSAMDALVDISELKNYYEANKDKTQEGYTEESYQIYVSARTAAEDVLNNENASREEVSTALTDLKNSVDGLTEKTEVKVSKELLQKLYDLYKALGKDGYTEESFAKLTSALEDAKKVLDAEDATQKQVDDAYSALKAAAASLEVKQPEDPGTVVNKDNLEKLYQANNSIVQGDYTTESYNAYLIARDAAKAVLDNPNVTQEQVAEAYNNLEMAVRGLTKNSQPDPSNPTNPTPTIKPNTSSNGGNTAKGSSSANSKAARTGDTSPIAGTACAALAAIVIAVFALKKRRFED